MYDDDDAFNCSESPTISGRPEYNPARTNLLTFLYVLLMVSGFTFPIVFWLAKRRYPQYQRLRARQTAIVVLAGVACILHAQAGPGMYVLGPERFPCWLRSLLSMLVVPFFCANILLKLTTFYLQTQLSRGIIEVDRLEDDMFQGNSSSGASLYGIYNAAYAMHSILCTSNTTAVPKNRLIVAFAAVTSSRATTWATVLLCIPCLALALIVMATKPEFTHACHGCLISLDEVIEICSVSAVLILFFALCAVRVWRAADPWHLRNEVLLSCFCCLVALIGFAGGMFFDSAAEETFDHQVELCVGFFMLLFIQTWYQVGMAHYEQGKTMATYNKKQSKRRIVDNSVTVSTFTGGGTGTFQPLTLQIILKNSELCAAFEDFMVAELSVESFTFIQDTEKWKRAYYTVTANARMARARRLYRVYIAPGANFEINVSSMCARRVREVFLDSTLADVSFEVFDEAREEITRLLQHGSILRFQLANESLRLPSDLAPGSF